MDEGAELQESPQIVGHPLQKGGAFRPGVPSLRTDLPVPLSPERVLLSISGVAAIVRENYESRYFTSHCAAARRHPMSFISYEA